MKHPSVFHSLWGRCNQKWFYIVLIACASGLLLTSLLWRSAYTATSKEPYQEPQPTLPAGTKPIYGWYICEDLGRGPVPGLTDIRYRVKLCHPDGWVVRAYCLRPLLDPPKVGTVCERTGEDTYWCGDGVQPLKEYIVKQTPPPPTPTPTATFTPTPTVTLRPPPGGKGFTDLSHYQSSVQSTYSTGMSEEAPASPTPTPFQPLYPTPTPAPSSATMIPQNSQIQDNQDATITNQEPPVPAVPIEPSRNFYGIDFTNSSLRIVIQIQPDDRRVNGGRPIVIAFFPGDQCRSEDKTACVNSYLNSNSIETIFVTVHSGVGNEGQAFRHAIEGTGYNQAALPLRQVKKNLAALADAKVTITQGDIVVTGLQLSTASRLPGKEVQDYINQPIESALDTASGVDASLSGFIESSQPILVFETCGWRMTGERWTRGITSTSASIYLGVIQKQ